MSITLVTDPSGTEKIVSGGIGVSMERYRVADAVTRGVLDQFDDGVWIEVGGAFYRNDLGAWLIGEMHPDPAMRFNTVDAAWVARTHRRCPVYALETRP